jgi:aspartyl-tRNA(Asn)/glutamyl-tRNA(Gln) amidotransferase subunit C
MAAPIDREQVRHIAKLARLTLREDEVQPMTEQLVKILAHVAQLGEVSTEGVEPTAQVGVERLPFRPDEVRPSLAREVVLAQAPETAGGGFVVPAFIDE